MSHSGRLNVDAEGRPVCVTVYEAVLERLDTLRRYVPHAESVLRDPSKTGEEKLLHKCRLYVTENEAWSSLFAAGEALEAALRPLERSFPDVVSAAVAAFEHEDDPDAVVAALRGVCDVLRRRRGRRVDRRSDGLDGRAVQRKRKS